MNREDGGALAHRQRTGGCMHRAAATPSLPQAHGNEPAEIKPIGPTHELLACIAVRQFQGISGDEQTPK
jgi:hypothetical protein